MKGATSKSNFASRALLGLLIVSSPLLSACNELVFRPANFDSECSKLKKLNRSLSFEHVSAVRFTNMQEDELKPNVFCTSECMEFMHQTRLPVLALVRPGEIPALYKRASDLEYYHYTQVTGEYKFSIVNSAQCIDVSERNHLLFDHLDKDKYDVPAVREEEIRRCIAVGPSEIFDNVVDVILDRSKFYMKNRTILGFSGYGNVSVFPIYFEEKGKKIGEISNIYYQIPPGPSSYLCEVHVDTLISKAFTQRGGK